MNNSILFLYAGDQQGAWGAISYPRPNHFYIMPGILYCAQILRDSPLFADYTIETRHVNRDVESIDDVCRQLCANEYACLGFSCYTWNTSDMLRLAREYKAAYPQVPVMLGGPDVEPRSEQQLISFFAAHDYIDAIAFGESEQKLVPFVRTLLSGDKDPKLSDCRGYGFHPRLNIEPDLQHEHAENLEHVPEIFPCAENVLHIPRDNTCGLAIVYETTRGCPYRCIYCRFSMHSHKIRRFDRKKWESELRWLLEQEVECIHVADAVFDLDKDHATAVLQTLREHNNATSLFFYCSFQRLDEELARLFQQSQCQIGVGVQSTNPAVLHSIRRALSPRLFEEGKSLLEKYPLNFYTDLIFGLPSDSLESFQESFNRVMKLNPSFVMAFPLTLIQGTPLGDSPQEFEVHPVDNALIASKDLQCDIHYRNLGLGKSFSIDQLDLFDDLAITLFYYFQRFPVSLDYLLKRSPHSPFTLFQQIGRQTKDYLRTIGKRASNTDAIEGFEDEIQRIFLECLQSQQVSKIEQEAFKELFKLDIMRILIMDNDRRKQFFEASRPWRQSRIAYDDQHCFGSARVIKNAYGKTVQLSFRYTELMRLDQIGHTIQPAHDTVLVFAPFEHWDATVVPLSPALEFCISRIEPRRPTRVKSLLHAYKRQANRRNESEDELITECLDALTVLAKAGYLLIHAASAAER